jgi:hypothetical protein
MTVKELIEHLKTVDPELLVFTKGYEGGFDDAEFDTEVFEVAMNYHKEWYYGKHESVKMVHKDTLPSYETGKGIVL